MPESAPDGGLLRAEHPPGLESWVGEDIQRALTRLDALNREVQQVEETLRVQRDEVARLAESVSLVDGRTQRHEAGQESAREMRQEIAALEERLLQEVSLRRDLSAQVERASQRESESQRELRRVLEVIASRLDQFDGREAASAERQRTIAQEIAADDTVDEHVDARLERLERQLAAEHESSRHQGTEIARLAGSLSTFLTNLDAIESRARTMLLEQRRLDDEVSALRSVRDREAELLEVVEQQRATRARLEDRVSRAEEALEEIRLALAAESEERALLTRLLAGESEQRRALGERIEAQRDAVVDHFRRVVRAEEESRRREIEEIERDIRVARGLMVRLFEQSDEAEQEQPL
jgi:chromosome segregation ATPase